ncbi:hypothetical protein JCM8097_009008 [Rhodosporidiobolus ruineniae]
MASPVLAVLTPDERKSLEVDYALAKGRGSLQQMKDWYQDRIVKYETRIGEYRERKDTEKLESAQGKLARTRERFGYVQSGKWPDSRRKIEVIDLVSSNSDGDSDKDRREDTPIVRTPKRRRVELSPPAQPPQQNFVDLTVTASDIERELSGRSDDGDAESNDDVQIVPRKPRSPSPELFAPGAGASSQQQQQQQPTPPSSPSGSNGIASGGTTPRRSKRAPKHATHYGNRVAHPHYGSERDDDYTSLKPKKRRKATAGGKGKATGKGKGKEKEVQPEDYEPIFLPPRIAASLLRLYGLSTLDEMVSSTVSLTELDDQNKEDDAYIEDLLHRRREWEKGMDKICHPDLDLETECCLLDSDGKPTEPVKVYRAAKVGDEVIDSGDYVFVAAPMEDKFWVGKIAYFHKHLLHRRLQAHILWFSSAQDLFSPAAHPRHYLLSDRTGQKMCASIDAMSIIGKVNLVIGTDETAPRDALFVSSLIKEDKSTSPLALNNPKPYCDHADAYPCFGCEDDLAFRATHKLDPKDGSSASKPYWKGGSELKTFCYDGHEYHVGDYIYLRSHPAAQEKPHWNGSQAPFRLARLLAIGPSSTASPRPRLKATTKITVAPLLRLGHVKQTATRQDRDLVITKEEEVVELEELAGHFELRKGTAASLKSHEGLDIFYANSFLPRSQDRDVQRSIASAWSLPPPLLTPHTNLRVYLDSRLQDLPDDFDLEYCDICKTKRAAKEAESDKVADLLKTQPLKALSLYSGLDLFSLGMMEGLPEMIVDYAIELDSAAAQACRLNHPGTKVIEDKVSQVFQRAYLADEDAPNVLDVDLVWGGPPCQSFSRANLHKFANDARSIEPFVFLSFFELGRPLLGLMENVAALVTFAREKKGDFFGLICDIAIRLGYDIRPSVVNAASFGVAANRRRLFLQLAKRGLPVPHAPEQTHSVFSRTARISLKYEDEDVARSVFTATTFRASILSAPRPGITIGEALQENAELPAFDSLGVKKGGVARPEEFELDGSATHVTQGSGWKEEARLRHLGIHGVNDQRGDYRDFRHDPDLAVSKRVSDKYMVNMYRRLWPDEISAALPTKLDMKGSNGARIHHEQARKLSVAECLILQGAPIDLKVFPMQKEGTPLGRTDVDTAYKLVGNAVTVPVGAAFAREWRKVLISVLLGNTNISAASLPTAGLFSTLSKQLDSKSTGAAGGKGKGKGKGKASSTNVTEPEIIILDDSSDEDADDDRSNGGSVSFEDDDDEIVASGSAAQGSTSRKSATAAAKSTLDSAAVDAQGPYGGGDDVKEASEEVVAAGTKRSCEEIELDSTTEDEDTDDTA